MPPDPTPIDRQDDHPADGAPVDPHGVGAMVDHFAAQIAPEATNEASEAAADLAAELDRCDEHAETGYTRRPPFASRSESVTKRPDWHFAAGSQEEAIARLLFLASHRRPAGLVTGGPGVGKTHALACVGQELRRTGHAALGLDLDGMDADGLVDQACSRVGLAPQDSEATLIRLRRLRRWVDGQLAAGGLTILADHIDRADASALAVLDRLLAQVESGGTSPTLLASAGDSVDGCSWLRRHAALQIAVEPMKPAELADFLDAGITAYEPRGCVPRFSWDAVYAIAGQSGGSVRTAAAIAQTAFVAAQTERFDTIDRPLVEAILPQMSLAAA